MVLQLVEVNELSFAMKSQENVCEKPSKSMIKTLITVAEKESTLECVISSMLVLSCQIVLAVELDVC